MRDRFIIKKIITLKKLDLFGSIIPNYKIIDNELIIQVN